MIKKSVHKTDWTDLLPWTRQCCYSLDFDLNIWLRAWKVTRTIEKWAPKHTLGKFHYILCALNGKHWNSEKSSSQFITHRFKANECQLVYFQHVSLVLFPGLNNLRCNILGLQIANCLVSVLKHSPPRSLTTQSSRGKKNSSWVSTYDQNDPATVAELQIIIFLERTYFRLGRRLGRTKKMWSDSITGALVVFHENYAQCRRRNRRRGIPRLTVA